MGSPINKNDVPGQETVEPNIFKCPQVLFSFSEEGRLILKEDTFEQIKCIQKSIIVVVVIGKYRTAKSWILNRMLGLKQGEIGFHVSDGQSPVTTNVLALCRNHPKWENSVVMFLDTEGLNSVGKENVHDSDNNLCAIVMLLCDVFIYNLQRRVDNTDLELISFVSHFTERTQPMRLNHTLPVFIQLVRDVNNLKWCDKVVSANEYLNTILKRTGEHNLDKIRDAIDNGFSSRLCYPLPCPVKPEYNVDDLNSWTDNSLLTVDYLKKEEEFKNRLFEIQPKKILSEGEMNGSKLSILIKNYLDDLANNRLPHIQSALEQVEELFIEEQCKKALDQYKSEMSKTADNASLKDKHAQVFEKVMKDFQSIISKSTNDKHKTTYKQRLEENIKREYEDLERKHEHELLLKKLEDKDRTQIADRIANVVVSCAVEIGKIMAAGGVGAAAVTGGVGAAAVTGEIPVDLMQQIPVAARSTLSTGVATVLRILNR